MKQTKERMRTHSVKLDMVGDVVITHLDRDHFHPVWCRTFLQQGVRVHLHESHIGRARAAGLDEACIVPFKDTFRVQGAEVEAVHVAHDALGTFSFIFDTGKTRFGFATDLGRVPQHLLDRFINLDGVAFESNYDPLMQEMSNRPEALKARIMDGGGHLSNEQSLAAICHIATESTLQHIVLLHLSRQCNSPAIIRDLYLDNLAHLYKFCNHYEPRTLLAIAFNSKQPSIDGLISLIAIGCNFRSAKVFSGKTQGKTLYDADM